MQKPIVLTLEERSVPKKEFASIGIKSNDAFSITLAKTSGYRLNHPNPSSYSPTLSDTIELGMAYAKRAEREIKEKFCKY
ncbi:MAG: hypothetical protein WC755_04010 [Candidatus Woesearchaeota archaeon]|jgi:hypothetical protein